MLWHVSITKGSDAARVISGAGAQPKKNECSSANLRYVAFWIGFSARLVMRKWILAAVAALSVGQAEARTVKLDGKGIDSSADVVWSDQEAIRVVEEGFLYYQSAAYPSGIIAVHDDYGIGESVIQKPDLSPFTITGLTLQAWNNGFITSDDPRPDESAGPEAIEAWAKANRFTGAKVVFLGGRADGSFGYLEVPFLSYLTQTVTFGKEFRNLEAFTITLYHAGYDHLYDLGGLQPHNWWCEEYCAQVTITSATVIDPSPVPIPATAPLLGVALIGLGFRRRA